VIFFEHRAMLDGAWARRPYPGNDFALPFGVASVVRPGTEITLVTWGAMVGVACAAADALADRRGAHIGVVDLRTLVPLAVETLITVAEQTGRVVVVHEDNLTAGFGAEIAAVLAQECFYNLDAPIERLAMPDIPSPHSPALLEAAVPSVARITQSLQQLASL
jgi:2-oxoisovalerate dehydrogenase E1 component